MEQSKQRRWLATFRFPIAVPVNGSVVMTSCLMVEEPLENNEGKPPKEVAERWQLTRTNSFRAVSLGDGRTFNQPIECIVGSYDCIAFAVQMPSE